MLTDLIAEIAVLPAVGAAGVVVLPATAGRRMKHGEGSIVTHVPVLAVSSTIDCIVLVRQVITGIVGEGLCRFSEADCLLSVAEVGNMGQIQILLGICHIGAQSNLVNLGDVIPNSGIGPTLHIHHKIIPGSGILQTLSSRHIIVHIVAIRTNRIAVIEVFDVFTAGPVGGHTKRQLKTGGTGLVNHHCVADPIPGIGGGAVQVVVPVVGKVRNDDIRHIAGCQPRLQPQELESTGGAGALLGIADIIVGRFMEPVVVAFAIIVFPGLRTVDRKVTSEDLAPIRNVSGHSDTAAIGIASQIGQGLILCGGILKQQAVIEIVIDLNGPADGILGINVRVQSGFAVFETAYCSKNRERKQGHNHDQRQQTGQQPFANTKLLHVSFSFRFPGGNNAVIQSFRHQGILMLIQHKL